MIISNTWVKVSNGDGIIIQNQGLGTINLAYSLGEPTSTDNMFIIGPTEASAFPSAGSIGIWLISRDRDSKISLNLATRSSDFTVDVATGRYPFHDATGTQGFRQGLSNGTLYDIWCGPSNVRTDLEVAEKLLITSTDTRDTFGNTGADFVVLTGLDANYNVIRDAVQMDGTNGVLTNLDFLRVNNSFVSGSNAHGNWGEIGLVGSGSGVTVDSIAEERAFSCTAAMTVPAGFTGVLTSLQGGCERNDNAQLIISTRIPEITGRTYFEALTQAMTPLAPGLQNSGFGFAEKSDIKLQVRPKTAVAEVTAAFAITFVPNL